MKKIIALLCLGLIGCATVAKENLPQKKIVNAAEIESAISVFTKTIKSNPNYAGAYYNRSIAYFHIKNYEKCRQDVHKAESLGLKFDPDFIKALEKASKT